MSSRTSSYRSNAFCNRSESTPCWSPFEACSIRPSLWEPAQYHKRYLHKIWITSFEQEKCIYRALIWNHFQHPVAYLPTIFFHDIIKVYIDCDIHCHHLCCHEVVVVPISVILMPSPQTPRFRRFQHNFRMIMNRFFPKYLSDSFQNSLILRDMSESASTTDRIVNVS